MTLIHFDEAKKQCMITADGVVIDTMRGSVYLTPEEAQKIAATIMAEYESYGEACCE